MMDSRELEARFNEIRSIAQEALDNTETIMILMDKLLDKKQTEKTTKPKKGPIQSLNEEEDEEIDVEEQTTNLEDE